MIPYWIALLLAGSAQALNTFDSIEGLDLRTQKNMTFSLKDKSPLVVVFLSSHCPCSQAHEESLKTLAEEYTKKGVRFLGIHSNADEHNDQDRQRFKKANLPFSVIEDESGKIADDFGALKTPHAYVVSEGKIVYQGGVDDSVNPKNAKNFYLKDAVAAVAAGKNPETKLARALGCVIKRP